MNKPSRKIRSSFRMLHAPCSMLHDERGQLLIESVIAISLVIVGMMAILGFLANALSLNRVVSDQLTATYLAGEGIEIVKNIIDSNKGNGKLWNDGLKVNAATDYSPQYDDKKLNAAEFQLGPLLYDADKGYGYKDGTATAFKRKVTLTPIIRGGTVNEYQVNSLVEWTSRGGGIFSINIEDHFYNWR